jgi:O-antigen/teichoic acid export membrane protein
MAGDEGERRMWMRFVLSWIRHDFFRVGAVYFIVSLLGSLVNLLCRVVLGRMLTPAQYGEMEAMMQVGAWASIPMCAVQTAVTREVARARGEGRVDHIGAIILIVGREMCFYAMIAATIMFLIAPCIRDFLKLNSVWPVYATSAVVLSGFLSVVVSGGLQGDHRFWRLGISSLFGPLSRVGLSWALIRPGFGATGALVAHAGSGIVMSLAGLCFVWDLIKKRTRDVVALGRMHRQMVLIMVTLGAGTVFGGIDIVIVKRVFSVLEAGDYARVSAMVRLALFSSGALTVALFPWVASEQAGGRKTGHLLGKALTVGLGLGVGAAILFTLVPGLVLGIFYGEVSADMVFWTRLMGWAMIPGNLLTIVFQYQMARQEYGFLKWMGPASVVYAALLLLFRRSIPAIIGCMGAGSCIIVAILAWRACSGHGHPLTVRMPLHENPPRKWWI